MPSAATSPLSTMPSAISLLSAYTNFAASAMLVRRVLSDIQITLNQILPEYIQEKVMSKIASLFGDSSPPSRITLIFDKFDSSLYSGDNEMYEVCEIFLRLKIPSSAERLKVFQKEGEKLSVTMVDGERAMDIFQGVEVEWEVGSLRKHGQEGQLRSINLSFAKENMETILGSYLPYVLERSKAFNQENRVLKLFSNDGCRWLPPVALNHPSTFETLVMDPKLKQDLINDLDRFVMRKDYYRRVGRAWKRGYLLYGPPGTGKSSLVAAMANYLKFHIYDLELTHVEFNMDLRWLLVSTKNRSVIVIEDIDCSSELQEDPDGRLTLSGLLNFIDGMWSNYGDQRIIVLTTNHKDRLDPALLSPGRMDMHIHMSYCTPCGFKTLVSRYLGVSNHRLFPEIERLITQVQVTPAQVAEELLKSDEADTALETLVVFLERLKLMEQNIGGLHEEAPIEGGLHQEADEKGDHELVAMEESASRNSMLYKYRFCRF